MGFFGQILTWFNVSLFTCTFEYAHMYGGVWLFSWCLDENTKNPFYNSLNILMSRCYNSGVNQESSASERHALVNVFWKSMC